MTRAARVAALGARRPYVILALGASNYTLDRAGTWSDPVPPNLSEWNWVDANSNDPALLQANPGTAFVPYNGTQKNMIIELARLRARAYPDQDVRVIRLARGGLHLAQFMAGAPDYPPDYDMWQIVLNNMGPALAAAGASTIDLLCFGGVADASPTVTGEVSDLPERMEAFFAQCYAQSWCPRTTPIIISSLTSGGLSTQLYWNENNAAMQQVVAKEPGLRQYVHLPDIPSALWTDGGLHPTYAGMEMAGAMLFNAAERGFRPVLVSRRPWKAIASTITWDGTPPSGAATLAYQVIQEGRLVTVKYRLSYATVGASNTSLTIAKPADVPEPERPLGYVAGEVIDNGYGGMATTPSGSVVPGRVWIDEVAGVARFNWFMGSLGYRLAVGTFQYIAAE